MVKLGEVFRYEAMHRLRSASTWIFAAVLFGIACSMMLSFDSRDSAVHPNAADGMAVIVLLLSSLFGLPVLAALFGDAAVRDVRAEMDPLLYATPLRRSEYLLGRFLAAAFISAMILFTIPLGFALPVLFGVPADAGYGPFRVGAYLQPYAMLVVPNMLFSGALLFTAGVLGRQILPVFLTAVPLFIMTMITMGPGEDAAGPVLSVLGPLGFHALNELTQYWTAAERNARLIGFPPPLMWNRVIWLTAAAAVLGLLHLRFRFAHPDGGRRRETHDAPEEAPGPVRPLEVPRVTGTFEGKTWLRQVASVARNSLSEIAVSRWFALVLLGTVVLTLIWGHNVGETVFDGSTWPVTFLIAETVLSERVQPLVMILVALYAGELVWNQRETGVAEIADAAPVSDGALLAGRFAALVALLVMVQAATLAGGVLVQLYNGYFDIEPGVYLGIGFGLNFIDYLLIAVLAVTVHVIVNQKYVAHMAVLLTVVLTHAGDLTGVRHHLLQYGTDPGWTWSDMNGLDPFIRPLAWFKVYWAAWALLLTVLAAVAWVRGRETGVRQRLRLARRRLHGAVVRTAGAAVALILVLGGFIFYNTNVLNDYRAAGEAGAEQARYEREYGRFRDRPQPTIVSAGLRIEIHPDQRAVDMRGTYMLVNRTGTRIDSLHVYTHADVSLRSIAADRPAAAVLTDEELGYRIHVLEQPLQPGEAMQLSWETAYRARGFRNAGNQTNVAASGASFNRMWMPFIGYQPMAELTDPEARERFGLPPRRPLPGPQDTAARQHRWSYRDADLVQVDAIIGTAADQIVVTPGVLRRTWTEGGRRWFHYRTDGPMAFGVTVFSAKYEVREDDWNDVALRIFHHPAHRWNIERIMEGMKASLDYYTTWFGPYPDGELRIVETPRYGGFGRAHPQIIAFTEDVFLARTDDGGFDRTFFGTAHEVAHTWWGGMVRSGAVRGYGLVSEGLANYSAMMVVEKTYGAEAARLVYDYQMHRYLRRRSAFTRDVPLLEVEHHPHIAYGKGAVAMYVLREHIGEAAVNGALRRFLEMHRDAGPPYPTALDLHAELLAATPDSLKYLLTDWFETITLWDVRTRQAQVERTAAGEYVVTLDVVARKLRADSIGNETEVPMNDLVEIGIFAAGERSGSGEPLHLQRHRIRSGAQTLRIVVPREPARAGIDPYNKLIDRRRGDNVMQVQAVTGSGGELDDSPRPGELPLLASCDHR